MFTHTDLDGVGNTVLAYICFGRENVDVEYCNYNDINKKVEAFLQQNKAKDYKSIYITDISVNEELAKKINDLLTKNNNIKFRLFDHHPTAMNLNTYNWAIVKPMLDNKQKNCGTKLFYDFLVNPEYIDKYPNLRDFIDIVRKYDTWEWKETNFILSKQLNDLLYILGIDDFVDEMYGRLMLKPESNFCLSEFDLKLLNIKQKEIDSYVKSCNKRMHIYNILGHNAGVVFAEQYSSEVGNKLCDIHPEIEFCVIINMAGSISYRSVGDEIDLGKDIASVYGGGGHPNSSGSPISDEIKNKIVEELFTR